MALIAALILSAQTLAAGSTAYDEAAAAARTEYRNNVAKCRGTPGGGRNCIKLAKTAAQARLSGTYSDAVAGAKAAYASTAARCRSMSTGQHRRCMKTARAERAMALGKAEEIRSAPLAMGAN